MEKPLLRPQWMVAELQLIGPFQELAVDGALELGVSRSESYIFESSRFPHSYWGYSRNTKFKDTNCEFQKWISRSQFSYQEMLPIPNATNGRTISLYFYQHYIPEINKLVCKKTLSYNTPAKLDAILYDQHALVIIARMFHKAYICLTRVFLLTFLLISQICG